MKLLLAIASMVALSVVQADDMSSIHLRVHADADKGGSCTITNESQCDGQNWSGSRCCADSNYECRWDDYGQNVKRCQKKKGGNNGNNNNGNNGNNGNNNNNNSGQCTITNESQCDGQNWSGSRCCADSNYECRWDDNGQNVKRCQKKKWHHHKVKKTDKDSIFDDATDSDEWDVESGESDYEDSEESDYDDFDESDYEDSEESDYDDSEESAYDDSEGSDYDDFEESDYDDFEESDYDDSDEGDDERHQNRRDHLKRAIKKASASIPDWGNCLASGSKCTGSSVCVKYSQYYAQCKPATLPAGELCGQNDGTNVWKYDRCPSGQTCKQNGSDFRCA